MSENLLSVVVFAPLALAGVVALLPSGEKGQLRVATLAAMVISFGLTLWLYLAFDPGGPVFQFEINRVWIESLGVGYHLGVDGLAVSMMLLTGFLGPIVVLSTWRAIGEQVKELCLALLVLQTAMLGTFAALDLALFYVFWEAMLVPMYLLVGVWGSDNRIYAAVKFFLYTFAASVLMLVAILFLWFKSGEAGSRTFDYFTLLRMLQDPNGLGWEVRQWLFLAFALAFAVKVPLFPLHTWLPDAHVEAPAAGSIILAGVLLKMGVFGFMRFAVPFFPDAAAWFRPAIVVLAVVGIVYGSLMAFAQKDMKTLVAYSSVAHLGFVMLGVFAGSLEASTGAMYQMISHGISTGALFLLIGIVYERTHTRVIANYGGIAKVTPLFAGAFLLVLLSSIGLPGTNGFVGEFLILSGTFTAPPGVHPAATIPLPAMSTPVLSMVAASGVVLGAIYMLKMYQSVMLGPVRHPENQRLADLSPRELCAVVPLIAVTIVMGVWPQPFLDRLEPSAMVFAAQMGGKSFAPPSAMAPAPRAESVAAPPKFEAVGQESAPRLPRPPRARLDRVLAPVGGPVIPGGSPAEYRKVDAAPPAVEAAPRE